MRIAEIKDRAPIVKAIEEFDRMERANFLKKYGFGRARSYWLVHNGRRYDSKAIVDAACGYLPGRSAPLTAKDFSGGDKTVRRLLEDLGFVVEIDGPDAARATPN